MKKNTRLKDIGNQGRQLTEIDKSELMALPYPYNQPDRESPLKQLTTEQKQLYDDTLDGVSAIGLRKPESKEEEEELINQFLTGLNKLLSKEDNWTFLQPLLLSLEYCATCQTCSEACPIFTSSGEQEIYRPIFRSELLRRIIGKYIKKEGKLLSKLKGNYIELNWETIARLAELAYRCTLCRRCAQACPMGIDNALLSREIRKLFSQEMGIAPKELHEKGTVLQLAAGSSTGITPKALPGIISFMEDEIEEKTGKKIAIPIDKKGSDILLLHNSGEFVSWPENVEAFAIIFHAANINWTLSSELVGYDAVNYGVWYDDIQFTRVAFRHAQTARKLKVKKILLGECGHAHKALTVVADRVLTGDLNIPRESALPLLEDIVCNDKIKLNPENNDFPVTLHDPCNIVRLMGIVEPQRRILRKICPQFREMEPHGVDNYCCGGGSGFAIMQSMNFPDWRSSVAGRMKLKQLLDTFSDVISLELNKYVCAPCSNCKGQIRDLFSYYQVGETCHIHYGGLVDLIVNAMPDLKEPFIRWEWL